MSVTFNIPKSFSFSRFHYDQNVRPIFDQLVEILKSMGGNEFIIVGTTNNSIYFERRQSNTYKKTENKIKSFMFGKEYTITRQYLAEIIEQEKERLSAVNDQKSKIETLTNEIEGLIPETIDLRSVTETKIELRISSSYLSISSDGSGSVRHKPYFSSYGVTTQQLQIELGKAVENEKTLLEAKVKLLNELKGFFKQ